MPIIQTPLRLALISAIVTAAHAAPPHLRTVTVGGTGGQPVYTLEVSAKGAEGTVDVRDAAGAKVQTLTCALEVPAFAPEMGAARIEAARREVESFLGQLFVDNLAAEDLNFDGYADLKAPREYAAKFQNFCVWLYDPRSHTFQRDDLAKQMERLSNLEADPKRHRVTSGVMIGNSGFSLSEYKIDALRLLPVQSCEFSNLNEFETTYTLTDYAEGQPGTTHTQKGSRPECGLREAGCDCIREKMGLQR